MANNTGTSYLGDLASINQIVDTINTERDKLARSEPGARQTLIAKARELISNLETPFEALQWIAVAEPTRNMASRVALDLNLYQTLMEDGGKPKTTEQLAKPTGASPDLVNRIARTLTATGMMAETGPGQYAPNHVTAVLAKPKYGEGLRFCFDAAQLSFFYLPEFLESKKYINPDDQKDGPFKFAYGTSDVWSWLTSHPKVLGAFFTYLQSQREDHPYWTDKGFYPIKERVVEGIKGDAKSESSAVLDIGGGNGYVLEDLRARVPELQGRLILQELPGVIEHVKSTGPNERLELMPHDFFTEQPIKGARVYFLRHVIHDYNDEVALKILGQIKKAMEPGYSKILLNECVVANQGAAWQHVTLDMFLMGMNASQERTEREWQDLIKRAGLEIAGIWSKGTGSESLIEVVLPS